MVNIGRAILGGAVAGGTIAIVIKAIDEFSGVFASVNKGMLAAGASITALGVAGAGAMAGFIKQAAEFEQTTIAFNTLLGSEEKAAQTLKELTDFAAKTPFTIPGIEKSARQLLAVGFKAEELIPTLRNVGDVAGGLGLGEEGLQRLIINLGQVRTQGKLTGRELRDFAVAGVPMIDVLTKMANEGKLSAESMAVVGRTSDTVRTKIDNLTFTIQKQERRLEEMKDAGNKSSAAYKNLRDTIERNNDTLRKLGPISDGVSKKIVFTKETIAEMVSEGKIGFQDVETAFASMSGEGGRFFNLMDKQSKSFLGQVSNIQDSFIKIARIMGNVFLPAAKFVAEKLQVIIGWMEKHPTLTKWGAAALAIGTALALIVGPLFIIVAMLPAFSAGLGLVAAGMTAVSIAGLPVWLIILAIIAVISALIVAGIVLIKHWDDVKEGARKLGNFIKNIFIAQANVVTTVWNFIVSFVENRINELIKGANKVIGLLNKIPGIDIGKIKGVDFGRFKGEIMEFERFVPAESKAGAPLQVTNVNINNVNGFNGRDIARELQEELGDVIRLN